MSEIGEACQVIVICGKVIWQLKNLTVFMAVSGAQVMSAIYHAKWSGDTSYKRLLSIKGEENGLLFVNIGLEENTEQNKQIMKGIQKELKDHGILYARLPDLCGGDGNTQICVSAKDAQKLSAMLMSHMNGKYKDIPIAEISQFDYTATAKRADGSPTEEYAKLFKSAVDQMMQDAKDTALFKPEEESIPGEEIQKKAGIKEKQTVKKAKRTLKGNDKEHIKQKVKESHWDRKRENHVIPDIDPLKGNIIPEKKDNDPVPVFAPIGPAAFNYFKIYEEKVREREQAMRTLEPAKPKIISFAEGISEKITSITGRFKKEEPQRTVYDRCSGYADGMAERISLLPKKTIAQIIREHDVKEFLGEEACMWYDSKPVMKKNIHGREYYLVSLPDGDKGIIVPETEFREAGYGTYSSMFEKKLGAFVSEDRMYYSVDYKTGDVSTLAGEEVLKEAKKPQVVSYARQMEKMMLDAKQKAMLGEKITQAVKRKL